MASPIKFNFKDLHDLDKDFDASKKVLPLVVIKILTLKLRQLRGELRWFIPHVTGRLERSFGFSVRHRHGVVTGLIGFFMGKGVVSANTAIAANVLQAGGATPKKGPYLWIPVGRNRTSSTLTPRQLIASGQGFIRLNNAGNRIAYLRIGDQAVPMFILKASIRLSRPPVPIEQRVDAVVPEIAEEIPETIRQVIEEKRAVT